MLQTVAKCFNMLQTVAMCCKQFQIVAICCNRLQLIGSALVQLWSAYGAPTPTTAANLNNCSKNSAGLSRKLEPRCGWKSKPVRHTSNPSAYAWQNLPKSKTPKVTNFRKSCRSGPTCIRRRHTIHTKFSTLLSCVIRARTMYQIYNLVRLCTCTPRYRYMYWHICAISREENNTPIDTINLQKSVTPVDIYNSDIKYGASSRGIAVKNSC